MADQDRDATPRFPNGYEKLRANPASFSPDHPIPPEQMRRFLEESVVIAYGAVGDTKPPRNTVLPRVSRCWTDVFARASYTPYGYAVRRAYQQEVRQIVHTYGTNLEYQYLGGMASYAGETWMATLLDGTFIHTAGVMWRAGEGTGNGMWLSGQHAVRYVLYHLGIDQPRRWRDEPYLPTKEELAESAVEARLRYESDVPSVEVIATILKRWAR